MIRHREHAESRDAFAPADAQERKAALAYLKICADKMSEREFLCFARFAEHMDLADITREMEMNSVEVQNSIAEAEQTAKTAMTKVRNDYQVSFEGRDASEVFTWGIGYMAQKNVQPIDCTA